MDPEPSAPLPLWIIALTALAPFPISAAIYAYGPEHMTASSLTVLFAWSAIVLAFLGGVRWGLEVARPMPRAGRLLSSVISPVGAWVVLLARGTLEAGWLLAGLLASFLLQWLFDHTATDVPARYPRLLTVLTLGACVSLAVAMEQALRM